MGGQAGDTNDSGTALMKRHRTKMNRRPVLAFETVSPFGVSFACHKFSLSLTNGLAWARKSGTCETRDFILGYFSLESCGYVLQGVRWNVKKPP